MKQNCWEFKNCGRQPNGSKVKELGVCPAAIETKVNGVNSGKNGGRTCWAVAGTYCGGKVQGSAAMKSVSCQNCDFFKLVWKDENQAKTYTSIPEILRMLR
ncbi:MAG TPA: hypothetical protein DIW31_05325 [Bacteroidales bacterium]|nr:hypothetical protein [Bacteroidales bacterium]